MAITGFGQLGAAYTIPIALSPKFDKALSHRRRCAPKPAFGEARQMAEESADGGEARSFKPISGNVMPRFSGIATFMRLPQIP
jgi:hypothetical protein